MPRKKLKPRSDGNGPQRTPTTGTPNGQLAAGGETRAPCISRPTPVFSPGQRISSAQEPLLLPSDGADHDEDDEHCRVFSSCCGNVVSSASSSLSDRNSSDEEARARHMARTEDRMRQRLLDFYLTPWERWHKKGVFPFKMVTQFVKLLAITAQLILFGSLNSTRVSYGERAVIAFKHLYLIDWDPQYETLPYPPSTGIYSVYTRERFYESIGFAIEQFNLTEEMTISGYSFADRNRTMQFCLNQVVHSGLQLGNYSTDNCNCVSVSVLGVPVEEVKTAEAVKNFLAAHNIIVDFMRLQTFRLNFQLSSPSIHHLDWDRSVECFQFNISITFDNTGQSGQVVVRLDAQPTEILCGVVASPPAAQEDGSLSSSFRRNIHLAVDLLAFDLSLLSALMCLRSIWLGWSLWRKTKQFFSSWYGIRLHGVFWEFVNPWYLLILLSDILIVAGSVFKLANNRNVLERYNEWSYLLGLGTLCVWLGVLRYVGFSTQTTLLMRTITRSVPGLLRFCVCALFIYFSFVLCAWVIIGPYHVKFRTFMSTLECLFSLINGDDMYVTFSVIGASQGLGIFLFSRLFLYIFITLFIYVVLNIFVTIIFEAYEEVKELQELEDHPPTNPLWHFIQTPTSADFIDGSGGGGDDGANGDDCGDNDEFRVIGEDPTTLPSSLNTTRVTVIVPVTANSTPQTPPHLGPRDSHPPSVSRRRSFLRHSTSSLSVGHTPSKNQSFVAYGSPDMDC
uniref:Mucolipin-3 n=1 Tax=Schistocephalus solidus TaxID=70667 RepID=A0A0V0J6F3_SCHSO